MTGGAEGRLSAADTLTGHNAIGSVVPDQGIGPEPAAATTPIPPLQPSAGAQRTGSAASGRCGRGPRLLPDVVRVFRKWFLDHRDCPYPNSVEKEELALQTGVTVKAVSTWFVNARKPGRRPELQQEREEAALILSRLGAGGCPARATSARASPTSSAAESRASDDAALPVRGGTLIDLAASAAADAAAAAGCVFTLPPPTPPLPPMQEVCQADRGPESSEIQEKTAPVRNASKESGEVAGMTGCGNGGRKLVPGLEQFAGLQDQVDDILGGKDAKIMATSHPTSPRLKQIIPLLADATPEAEGVTGRKRKAAEASQVVSRSAATAHAGVSLSRDIRDTVAENGHTVQFEREHCPKEEEEAAWILAQISGSAELSKSAWNACKGRAPGKSLAVQSEREVKEKAGEEDGYQPEDDVARLSAFEGLGQFDRGQWHETAQKCRYCGESFRHWMDLLSHEQRCDGFKRDESRPQEKGGRRGSGPRLKPEVVKVLTTWFLQHAESPYPDEAQKVVLYHVV